MPFSSINSPESRSVALTKVVKDLRLTCGPSIFQDSPREYALSSRLDRLASLPKAVQLGRSKTRSYGIDFDALFTKFEGQSNRVRVGSGFGGIVGHNMHLIWLGLTTVRRHIGANIEYGRSRRFAQERKECLSCLNHAIEIGLESFTDQVQRNCSSILVLIQQTGT